MLRVEALSVAYGAVQVLHEVSVGVTQGEAVAILGPNGAGKTTLLRTISGLLHPRPGRVLFEERDVTGIQPQTFVRQGVAQVMQGRQLFGPLTVLENLRLGAYSRFSSADRNLIEADLERVFTLFPILRERRRQRAGTLSGGEQQMLAIGRALMSRPRLLLLDEPSLGLAPLAVAAIFEALRALRDSGLTMLLVEQNPDAALATRCYVLEVGRVVYAGEAKALGSDTHLAEYYLGLREEV
ncbi:MAG: ABC transporter ATP-binding protein [Candidatus Rokubacteria bacterium]|nr:ABC transporter ATP-binding protein [Candidatus Rokubacteria bacterium]